MNFFFFIFQLHAEYDRDCDDYKAHRVIQSFDTAQFIESTRGDSVLQVLAGDLNTEPGDLAHRYVKQFSSNPIAVCSALSITSSSVFS